LERSKKVQLQVYYNSILKEKTRKLY